MKKQMLIISIVTVSTILFSCSKEKLEMPKDDQSINEEMVAPPPKPTSDLSLNLEGCYEFNNSLEDKTNKLGAAYSSTSRLQYGPDRNGSPNSSMVFQGNHYLQVSAVPRTSNSSVSVWIKYNTMIGAGILTGAVARLAQHNGSIIGATNDHIGVVAEYFYRLRPDNAWHHIVIAADPLASKFYLNGKLVKTVSSPLNTNGFSDYFIGSSGVVGFWTGSMDDLRFYSRTLTSTDVKALFEANPDAIVQ